MNFLAHLYLSRQDGPELVGNFMGDFVKGGAYAALPLPLAQGVRLHRLIDHFTDNHPLVRAHVQQLRPQLGRYTAIALDVYYDHLLARDWLGAQSLPDFAAWAYAQLEQWQPWLPPKAERTFLSMRKGDWLSGYAHPDGVQFALGGLDYRSGYRSGLSTALPVLQDWDAHLQVDFPQLLQDLEQEVGRFRAQDL